MEQEKLPKLLLIMDDRVSNDKAAVLSHAIKNLKKHFNFEIVPGQDITEAQLVQKLEKQSFHAVLVPYHRYQTWSKIEGFMGMNRTSGPAFAGYFCEPLSQYKLADPSGQNRRILIDFYNLSTPELVVLLRSLVFETQRSGLRPLLEPSTPVYCENWYGSQGLGGRIDSVLALPEIAKAEWAKRSGSIRILLSAFWSLVYEEGPGKVDTQKTSNAKTPKAYFQIAADAHCLVLRLYYFTLPHNSPKEAVKQFWPDKLNPTKASQLLNNYGDFLRVHTIQETSDIEVVVGLFHSAPSEKFFEQAHSIWIEPLSAKLISEMPYEAPGPKNPLLRALPNAATSENNIRMVHSNEGPNKDRFLTEAATKIKDLREKIQERDQTIHELKSGGIGTSAPLPPPDAEGLLDAFQSRYFDAKYQIRQFEMQIAEMEQKGTSPAEIETLRLKMEALMNRQKAWIKKLLTTLESYKESVKKSK